jgi:uncharacterized delta-60 repeat protein
VLALESRVLFSAGDLNPSFGASSGTPGWVRTNMGNTYDEATSVAVQPDGKIIAAGYGGRFSAARYLPDGRLDTTFGNAGRVQLNGTGDVQGMGLRSDGKIILAGSDFNSAAGRWDVSLARLNANGTLDGTFGSGGRVYADFGDIDDATGMALQADGKIVVSFRDAADFRAARFNENGSVDTSFGTGGSIRTDFGSTDEFADAVLIQSDGRILLGGRTAAGHTETAFALARYTQNGTPDVGFGTGGRVTVDVPGPFAGDEVHALAQQADGKIIAAGSGGQINFALARVRTDGTPDPAFGTAGVAQADVGQANNGIEGVVLQADGRIVAAGFSRNNNQHDFAVARFDTGGRLDPSFSGDGMVISDFGTAQEAGNAVALAPDGDIIVAGDVGEPNVNNDFAVVRYQGDPPAFDFATLEAGGILSISGTAGDDVIGLTNTYAGELIATLNGLVERFPYSAVNTVLVNGGDGNDTFTIGVAVFTPTHLLASGGRDSAVFNGSEGNDEIVVTDRRVTGGGNDLFLDTIPASLVVNGRFGYDTIRTDGRVLFPVTMDGGEGNDTLTGSGGNDGYETFLGGGGDDTIYAQTGWPNVVDGGPGTDRATTDPNDTVTNVEVLINSDIGGTVYNDANGNGTRDAGEASLGGFHVYLDANNNGVFDAGEVDANTGNLGPSNYFLRYLSAGSYTVRVEPQAGWQATAPAGGAAAVTLQNNQHLSNLDFGFTNGLAGRVRSRMTFYNNSSFDGRRPGLDDLDFSAIATDKAALLPGQAATPANVTTFGGGVNGVVVDLSGAAVNFLGADDFEFATGDGSGGWTTGSTPSAAMVVPSLIPERPNDARVYLALPDGTARGAWVRVTGKANEHTHLGAPDVFYFGNLPGDADGSFRVNALDVAAVKRALNTTVGVTSPVDFNRDGRVNALDVALVKQNLNRLLSPPAVTAPPASFSSAGAARELKDELQSPGGLPGGVLGGV